MKVIGLIGGMSWESSAEYYRLINQEVGRRLGGHHSARSVMVSVDFHEVEAMQAKGDWDTAASVLCTAGRAVAAAGAGCVVICTNTMHRMADEVEEAAGLPLIHIADATAGAVSGAGIGRVALLGTRYTMEQDFYRGRLEERHGLEVIVPEEPDRTMIHDVIYNELVRGVIEGSSREKILTAIDRLVERGAQGVIAGCTEIELLVGPEQVPLPYFPTTRVHAMAAVDWALS